jgi:hypothetical protein
LTTLKRKTPASSSKATAALLPPRYDLQTTAGKASLYREQATLLTDLGTSLERSLHAVYADWCLRVSELERHAATLLSLRELKKEIEMGCERLTEVMGRAKQVAEVLRGQEGASVGKALMIEAALEEIQRVRERVGRAKEVNGIKIEVNLINKAMEDAERAMRFEDIVGYPEMPRKIIKMYEYFSKDLLDQLQKSSSQSNS